MCIIYIYIYITLAENHADDDVDPTTLETLAREICYRTVARKELASDPVSGQDMYVFS